MIREQIAKIILEDGVFNNCTKRPCFPDQSEECSLCKADQIIKFLSDNGYCKCRLEPAGVLSEGTMYFHQVPNE